jgi:hypothetical protein
MTEKAELAGLVRELAVVHGKVTLSSGKEADYYVDLRRATLHHRAAPLIGKLLRDLVADWDFDSVGGLTMGADPVAMAVMHAEGRPIDAFVVRKAAKAHGMQRQIEGPDVVGKRVLVVEDTTTWQPWWTARPEPTPSSPRRAWSTDRCSASRIWASSAPPHDAWRSTMPPIVMTYSSAVSSNVTATVVG